MKHYSKNDILDLQLKYKHDDTVLDLVAAVDAAQDVEQEWKERAEDAEGRVDDLESDVDALREQVNKLEKQLDEKEQEVKK